MALQTQAARLASFKVTSKKRSSSAKGAKTLHWPHKKPAPAELAAAGFIYKPTAEFPDNATCFLCNANIEGWEADDDPLTEHLTHAPNCGWAINVCLENNIEVGDLEYESPTSARMFDARMTTFDSGWPHEKKKGWKCQARKMAEAGWFFCPTEESEDYVKCPYCGLCLDGWERKDDPYDAHQSRNPDCKFFEQPAPKAKTGRGRKGRTSKASRMSTQSNLASAMEEISIADPVDTGDESVMMLENDSIIHPGLRKGAKNVVKIKQSTAKPRGKATNIGAEESIQASSVLEPEDDDFEVKVTTVTTKAIRGKKRKSEDVDHDSRTINVYDAEEPSRGPPAKRRATRTRANTVGSESTQVAVENSQDADLPMTDSENMPPPSVQVSKKAVKGGRKKASSTVRKASATSTASMASLRATVPNDEELEAALEADLDRPLTDEDDDEESLPTQSSRSRRLTKTRPTSRNATASIAPTRRMTRTSALPDTITHELETHNEQETSAQIEPEPETQPVKRKRVISRKVSKKHADPDMADASNVQEAQARGEESDVHVNQAPKSNPKRTRQTSRQVGTQKPPASDVSIAPAIEYPSLDMNSSALESRTAEDDSGHETDASVANQAPRKRGPKKGGRKPKAGKKTTGMMSRNIEDIVQRQTEPEAAPEIPDEQHVDAMVVDEPDPFEVNISEVAPPTKAPKKKNTKSTKSKTVKAKPVIEEPLSPAPMTDEPWADHILGESTPIPSAPPKVPTPSPVRSVRAATPIVAAEVIEASPKVPSAQQTPRPAISPQSSDAENRPPSSRPSALRPPLEMPSPSKAQTIRVPLAASTPITSPSKRNISKLQTSIPWTAVDFEKFFAASPNADKENMAEALDSGLTSPEKKLTVEEWIYQNARKGEEKLRNECERLVGKFEGEGVRALKSLEGIRCAELI